MRVSEPYTHYKPASPRASAAARGSSKKEGTAPEIALRRALWGAGCRYRKNPGDLPGKPDLGFPGSRVVVFCDGDFWHGKDWERRKERLRQGHNAAYWTAKIERNMARDRQATAQLEADGWTVLRFWESDIKKDVAAVVAVVARSLVERKRAVRPTRVRD